MLRAFNRKRTVKMVHRRLDAPLFWVAVPRPEERFATTRFCLSRSLTGANSDHAIPTGKSTLSGCLIRQIPACSILSTTDARCSPTLCTSLIPACLSWLSWLFFLRSRDFFLGDIAEGLPRFLQRANPINQRWRTSMICWKLSMPSRHVYCSQPSRLPMYCFAPKWFRSSLGKSVIQVQREA